MPIQDFFTKDRFYEKYYDNNLRPVAIGIKNKIL